MGYKRKYNHAYDIAFSVDTDNLPSKVTAQELLAALRRRLRELEINDEIVEACGLPFDSYAYDGSEMPDEDEEVSNE